MKKRYRVLPPLAVTVEPEGRFEQGDVFEHEFDPAHEAEHLASGLLELVAAEPEQED